MRFHAKNIISAPSDIVYGAVITPQDLEKMAQSKGVKVIRTPDGPVTMGTTWDVSFKFRGRTRIVTMKVTGMTEGEQITVKGSSGGMDMIAVVDTIALNPAKSRLSVTLEAKPRSLAARLLVQSAKLARKRLDARYEKRVESYAAYIADRVELAS